MSVPIEQYVDVTISRETRTVAQENFGMMLILGPNGTFTVNTTREYNDIDEVAVDFASSTDEYKAANAAFSQTPAPTSLKIGVRATPVAQVQTFVLDADLITGNIITVDVDGVTVNETYATSHLATMTAFASSIQGQPGVTTAVVGGASNRTITITAAVAGVPVVLDNEGITGGASQASITITTTVANVGVTEDLTNIAINDDDWYALVLTTRTQAFVEQAVAYVEAHPKIFVTASSDTDIYDAASTTDIAYVISNASRSRTAVIFNETPADFPDAAWLGRMLPTDPGSATWMFKELSGITASDLTATQRSAVLNKNANLYVTSAGASFMEEGTVGEGEYLDVIRGIDWLASEMKTNIFGALINRDKIPYTNAGIGVIKNLISEVLDEAIESSLLVADPDSYDGKPYYLDVPELSEISDNDKGNRLLPDVEWQATLAGAIHKVTITGRVVL